MSVKLGLRPAVYRMSESGKSEHGELESIKKGDEVDLLASALLYVNYDEETGEAVKAGWSLKIHQIKLHPRQAKIQLEEMLL